MVIYLCQAVLNKFCESRERKEQKESAYVISNFARLKFTSRRRLMRIFGAESIKESSSNINILLSYILLLSHPQLAPGSSTVK